MKADVKAFKEKYKAAKAVIPDQPLAYKLVCAKVKEKTLSRFGGMPDWSMTLCGVKKGKFNFDRWPKCATCCQPMSFIAQIPRKGIINAIHIGTGTASKYGDVTSPLGWSSRSDYGVSDDYWMVFACLDFHHGTPAHNAAMLVGSHYVTPEIIKKYKAEWEEDKPPFGQEQARAFAKEHKVRILPSFSFNLDLRFEVDHPRSWDIKYTAEDYERFDKEEEAREKAYKDHPELFHDYGDVAMFGEPASQQDAKRPWGANGYVAPYRMASLINWSDDKADVTYQVYMDMQWSDRYEYRGILDASCT